MLYKLARSLVKRWATSAPRFIPIVLRLVRLILPHISQSASLAIAHAAQPEPPYARLCQRPHVSLLASPLSFGIADLPLLSGHPLNSNVD